MIGLLSVDRLNRGANSGQEILSADVPICGSFGIRPDDSVAVQFVRQAPPARPRVTLSWASRPEIAAPFLSAVAQNPNFRVQDGQATAVVLKCRQSPSGDYQVKANLDDQILTWSTSRGAYPLLDTGDAGDTASFASLLAERKRRYGPKSVMLLPILLKILGPTIVTGFDNQEARTRAAALSHRTADIVATTGGPADISLLSALSATGLDVAAQNKSVAVAQGEFQELLTRAAHDPAASLDTLYMIVSSLAPGGQAPNTLRALLLEQTIAVIGARSSTTDPRVGALGLQLLAVRREQGDGAAVGDLVKRFGFSPSLCSVAMPAVRFGSSNITADDYPPDLVQTLMQGRTILEFDLDVGGNAIRPRILVSDPPFAFDAIAITKSSTIVYEPAKSAGVARSCSAQIQPIRWQMPY